MWKTYSISYLRQNRTAGISIMAAALGAAFFLSLLCSLFYNFWVYDVESIRQDEGSWHVRVEASLDREELELIRDFAGVESAEVSGEVTEICFEDARETYRQMALIWEKLELDPEEVSYHETLLSRYLAAAPGDPSPPLLLPFFIVVLAVLCVSLALVIRTAFEISMQARVRQFGIFSSIGASPGQIRRCLLQEAAALCALPVLGGMVLGGAGCAGVLAAVNRFAADVPGRHRAIFHYHPAVFAVSFGAAALTVLVASQIPAGRLARQTPLEAVRGQADGMTGRRRRWKKKGLGCTLLGLLLGIEGELAGNALRTQKKALRISRISLTLSFLGFTSMLSFFTLSGISTRYTYFDRYQDAWDVMVTVRDTELEALEPEGATETGAAFQIKEIPGVRDSICYQKAEESIAWDESRASKELRALGGYSTLADVEDASRIPSQVLVMDDECFLDYCRQTGAPEELTGTILLNRIWDSTGSSFRQREYIPFVEQDGAPLTLYTEDGKTVQVPVLSYAEEAPLLREEYEDYALVQFMPLSLWKTLADRMDGVENDTYIRILGPEEADLETLDEIEREVEGLLESSFRVESENRIEERLTNDQMLLGARLILGALCVLLGGIGLAGIFTNTFGFLRQRQREFARYLSVGMDPAGMKKLFCIEAAVIAGRPILLGLLVTVPATALMVSASQMEADVFLAEAPFLPVAVYGLFIMLAVALAYWLGARRLLGSDLSGPLKDDTLS